MAKAKSTKPTSQKKSTKAAKPAKSAGGAEPMIDTALAAQSAAKMLVNKPASADLAAAPKKESAAFKNMKESLNKPHLTGLDNVIGSVSPQRNNASHFQQRQAGRNQTFGADVNRVGVPRRTPG